MTCLGSKDTTTEIIFDTNTLSTACNIWSAPALNGILWPFSSDSTPELHERSEKALISFVCSDEATLSTSDFLTKFEQLLDKFGIEAVLFLTSRRIRETSGNVALGKKCVIRSRFAEPKVEFRIRNGGELKKLRIDWSDLEKVEVGENSGLPIPAKFTIDKDAELENCYLRLTTKKVGEFDVLFRSAALRDACLRGFKLIALTRDMRNSGSESIDDR